MTELEQAAEVYSKAVATRIAAGDSWIKIKDDVQAAARYFEACVEDERRAISQLKLSALGGVMPEGGL